MPLISVKTKKGRVAFSASRGGVRIPDDKFVEVEQTPYINRLIDYHGDLEVEKAPAAKADAKPAPAPVADKTTTDKG